MEMPEELKEKINKFFANDDDIVEEAYYLREIRTLYKELNDLYYDLKFPDER